MNHFLSVFFYFCVLFFHCSKTKHPAIPNKPAVIILNKNVMKYY